jgi:acetyltransferase-like isoleucine patch superfamily enzyme
VIIPKNTLPEGVAVGALTFIPAAFVFKPWSVYAGIPARFIKKRDRKSVLRQAAKIESSIGSSATED